MLSEALLYLTLTGSSLARRMGYAREVVGIRSRWHRCQAAWAPHLAATRHALLQSAANCRHHRRALVLGAGALHDIPLTQLARHFSRIDLVDLAFLPHTRWMAYRLGNVRCVLQDATEALALLERAVYPEGALWVASQTPRQFADEPDIDWIASVNLWSQLPILPILALRARHPDWPEGIFQEISRRLLQGHLDYLGRFSALTCLIADRTQVSYQSGGEEVERSDFASSFPLLQNAQQVWRWDVAPLGEAGPGLGAWHEVVVCERLEQAEQYKSLAILGQHPLAGETVGLFPRDHQMIQHRDADGTKSLNQ
ncbi:MAG: hypothetical protein WCP34_12315 [Pseudomonadota bacterium]